jgi:hypothetical protein
VANHLLSPAIIWPGFRMIRNGSKFDVNSRPTSVEDAIGACASYLSGTRSYREWKISEDLKARELKNLNLTDFRTKQAKQLRDARLDGKTCACPLG